VSTVRSPLVVANWKMNLTPSEAERYCEAFRAMAGALPARVAVAFAPAFPALERAGRLLSGTPFLLAAQDVHTRPKGAFTGEVSAPMLGDLNVVLCLVGHSERRTQRGELEADLAEKMASLTREGIATLYCIGETLAERQAGETVIVLGRQLSALDAFPAAPPAGFTVAYEPVWAIGSGQAATPEIARATHRIIRDKLGRRYGERVAAEVRILYGGSVTPANAGTLGREEDIDGALVGGASLVPQDFAAIVTAFG
jgi:triosephosphate isomerase